MMKDRRYVVYRHIFPNGKSYIGITCVKPYYYRWRAGSSYKSQPKMYNAILKYGWDNIQHEILFDDLSQEEANLKEQEMIEKYNSIDNGYNVSIGCGGTYGIPCSDETKKKISEANKGKQSPQGIKNLEKYRKEHGAWNKGEHLTPTQYEKISRERKERCSKAITAYNPITNEAVLHFDSCTDASKHLGVSKSCIARCAKGGRKTSAGYVWRYDNDNI